MLNRTIAEYKDMQQAETKEQYKLIQHLKESFDPKAYERMSLTFVDDNTVECMDDTDEMILQLRGNLVYEIGEDFEEAGDNDILRGTV